MNPPPNRIEDEQFRTPLFDALVNLAESRKVSFHTPGHKSGKGIATRFRKFVGPRVFSIDLTTLDEVDSLQNPTGVIKEAQELAAKSAGADLSYFLVNGTTVGNHAMVASTTGPGDKVLIARNCHRSVLEVEGEPGRYRVRVKEHSRYIDPLKCTLRLFLLSRRGGHYIDLHLGGYFRVKLQGNGVAAECFDGTGHMNFTAIQRDSLF